MKKIFLSLVLCFFLSLSIIIKTAISLPWNPNDDINYSLIYSVQTPFGSGGLFTITNEKTGAQIQTFCLELNEYIYQTDKVAGISYYAVLGGRGGGRPDPISSATDWLYAQFIQNPSAYNPKALQIAFWLLEDEMTQEEASSWSSKYGWSTELGIANNYITEAINHTGTYGTQVLNLKDANESPHQSHLIYVPEPSLLILLGIGLSAVGLAARRRRK